MRYIQIRVCSRLDAIRCFTVMATLGLAAVLVLVCVPHWWSRTLPARAAQATRIVTSRAWSACPSQDRERLRGMVVFKGVVSGSHLAAPTSDDAYSVTLYHWSDLGMIPYTPRVVVDIRPSDLAVRSIGRTDNGNCDPNIVDFESLVAMVRAQEAAVDASEDVSDQDAPSRGPNQSRRTFLATQVQESFLGIVRLASDEAKKTFPMVCPEKMDYTVEFVSTSDGRVMWYTVTFDRVVIGTVVPYREIAVTLSGDTLEVIRVVRLH